jgi:hypothetical protein
MARRETRMYVPSFQETSSITINSAIIYERVGQNEHKKEQSFK